MPPRQPRRRPSYESDNMSAQTTTYATDAPPLDLSKWRNAPVLLIAGGMVLAVLAGLKGDARYFGHCYLMAYIFFLSISLGCLFLVLIHHLFDAGWSKR